MSLRWLLVLYNKMEFVHSRKTSLGLILWLPTFSFSRKLLWISLQQNFVPRSGWNINEALVSFPATPSPRPKWDGSAIEELKVCKKLWNFQPPFSEKSPALVERQIKLRKHNGCKLGMIKYTQTSPKRTFFVRKSSSKMAQQKQFINSYMSHIYKE